MPQRKEEPLEGWSLPELDTNENDGIKAYFRRIASVQPAASTYGQPGKLAACRALKDLSERENQNSQELLPVFAAPEKHHRKPETLKRPKDEESKIRKRRNNVLIPLQRPYSNFISSPNAIRAMQRAARNIAGEKCLLTSPTQEALTASECGNPVVGRFIARSGSRTPQLPLPSSVLIGMTADIQRDSNENVLPRASDAKWCGEIEYDTLKKTGELSLDHLAQSHSNRSLDCALLSPSLGPFNAYCDGTGSSLTGMKWKHVIRVTGQVMAQREKKKKLREEIDAILHLTGMNAKRGVLQSVPDVGLTWALGCAVSKPRRTT